MARSLARSLSLNSLETLRTAADFSKVLAPHLALHRFPSGKVLPDNPTHNSSDFYEPLLSLHDDHIKKRTYIDSIYVLFPPVKAYFP